MNLIIQSAYVFSTGTPHEGYSPWNFIVGELHYDVFFNLLFEGVGREVATM